MLFVVIAMDGTDPEAPERRRRVRQAHLEGRGSSPRPVPSRSAAPSSVPTAA
jgi:hypothetical protein